MLHLAKRKGLICTSISVKRLYGRVSEGVFSGCGPIQIRYTIEEDEDLLASKKLSSAAIMHHPEGSLEILLLHQSRLNFLSL